MPDPSTLDAEGDDNVPLSLVKEKQSIERATFQQAAPASGPSQVRRAPQPDLFAENVSPPGRAESAPSRVAPKAEAAPPKQTKPADSLLGLDFFGDPAPAPNRPSSVASTPGAQSRPDLKQSILSLYASRPPQQQPQHSSSGSFGGMQSPTLPQQQPQQSNQASFGGMNDAFGSLSFSSAPSPPLQNQPSTNAFSGLGNISNHRSAPPLASPPAPLGGGSFFDAKPAPAPPQASRGMSSSSGFGSFSSAPQAPGPASTTNASSSLGDLFDFSTPASQPPAPKQTVASPPQQSVFNLSPSAPAPKAQSAAPAVSGWSNHDAWGSNAAWGASPPSNPAPAPRASGAELGWGSGGSGASPSMGGSGGFAAAGTVQPKVSADEDFGSWSTAAPAAPAGTAPAKQGAGFAASEDLFSNVWE
jgi:stromal membrane-associated protein